MSNEEKMRAALKARLKLSEDMRNMGRPTHPDYWVQSIYEVEAQMREALALPITPPAPAVPQGNDQAWTLAAKVREALDRKACPGYYMDIAVEAVVHNFTPAAPSQEPAVNLSCKSTQARLAAQWGYVPAPSQPVPLTDEQIKALVMSWAHDYGKTTTDLIRSVEAHHGICKDGREAKP